MAVQLTCVVTLANTCQHCFKHLHKHGAQFKEVIVFWVLHFYHSPGVQTPSDLLSFHLNKLIGANHSKGNAGLKQEHMKQWDFGSGGMEKRMENMFFCLLLHQLRLSLSGPWSALWTLRPHPSRHQAAGRFWSHAPQSHPGSDDGRNKDRMQWWGWWPDCDLLWHVLLNINSTLDCMASLKWRVS